MGILLLGFALECMIWLALHGGAGILEHPKEPEPEQMVSIWRLPILQLILLLPRTKLLSFAQGLLGAPSAKPTTLLVIGLCGLEADSSGGRITADLPMGTSVGRDAAGHYRTAPLKEYPPALCRAMAQAFFRNLTSECTGEEVTLPQSFLDLVKKMRDKDFSHHISHDG